MTSGRPAAAVVLLGCPRNRVDAEALLGAFGLAGYAITTQPALADVVVITTCAFLSSAVAESAAAIRRALAARLVNPGLRVVIAGCMVQRYGRSVLRKFPGVELAAGVDYLTDIPRLLRLRTSYASSEVPTRVLSRPRLLSTPAHYAYLKIADGCSNRCSYCLIPGIRGPLRSRSVPDLVEEAGRLVASGVRELVLVAEDTTSYGVDRYKHAGLVRLLRRLAGVRGLDWLRLMYAHPSRFTPALMREFDRNPRLCRYVDLPIQHVNDRVLARMNRGYRRVDLERLMDRLKAAGVHVRTTVIVGFPGETDAEFSELLDFLAAMKFERLGAYAFSAETGTRAATLRPQVPKRVRQERLTAVMKLQARISRYRLRQLHGKILRVLAERPGLGRTEWDAPDIDGVVRFRGGTAVPGRFVDVRVTGSGTHDLTGRIVQ